MLKNKMNTKIAHACAALALVCAFSTSAQAEGFMEVNGPSILGGALGGGAGAIVGSSIGGRDGAIIGGAIGAAAGVAIASQTPRYQAEPRYRPAPRVYYQPAPRVYYQPAPRGYMVYERDWRGPRHHDHGHGHDRYYRYQGYGY
ncbi:glycine zipper domain-containing protein [Methylovorus sp. MP688]|uniref:glycine zipper domain-containing protein n=1 Tax=Methylovorus sp. (strain MP688) TaxID=887061 RepID=UPI0001EC457E|nr:glycine zipper domain-containing protein [Methylovorus sp. MP688]ADQ84086.1 17 kDa surface antigen [Methylovorus sp. MP688]